MSDEKNDKTGKDEQRSYFRVDDILSVVVNPVHIDKEKMEEFRESIVSSKAFSLVNVAESSEHIVEEISPDVQENNKLYSMVAEIKTKLDFIINHFILEKEGFDQSDKKFVNISASGIRFTVNYPVSINDIMEIKLLLPAYPPVVVFAYGEVKRVDALDENTYEVALEYINMGDSVRNEIIQYTLTHQRETIRKLKESEPGE
jgi:hypothetical protein